MPAGCLWMRLAKLETWANLSATYKYNMPGGSVQLGPEPVPAGSGGQWPGHYVTCARGSSSAADGGRNAGGAPDRPWRADEGSGVGGADEAEHCGNGMDQHPQRIRIRPGLTAKAYHLGFTGKRLRGDCIMVCRMVPNE